MVFVQENGLTRVEGGDNLPRLFITRGEHNNASKLLHYAWFMTGTLSQLELVTSGKVIVLRETTPYLRQVLRGFVRK